MWGGGGAKFWYGSTNPGNSVFVRNPNPPVPAAPSSFRTAPYWVNANPYGNVRQAECFASIGAVSWADSYDAECKVYIQGADLQFYYGTYPAYNNPSGDFEAGSGDLNGGNPQSAQMRFRSNGPSGSSSWSGWYNATLR